MEVKVLNIKGAETGKKVQLDETIFGIQPNDHAIYLDVKQMLANARQGTAKAKTRGEISGSTRKIKKQKGTGTARAGSIKSPVFVGGGRIFGPQPKDWSQKLNKKVKCLARKSALTYKAKANEITVVEDFDFEAPKTKNIVELQKNLKLNEKKTLLVLAKSNNNVYLSSRNLQGFDVVVASDINTYVIMKAKNIVLVESSVKEIESLLK